MSRISIYIKVLGEGRGIFPEGGVVACSSLGEGSHTGNA